ncbi:MAG: DUF3332 family protein [Prevotella sp.]|jgi:hypothetical protein|nr:DUF3332 family protein [Prevotella sp.]
MKKISLKVATCLLAGCFLLSSCYVGKFALFNKYAKWQTTMTSNKFVNAIVGFIIGPFVGGICTLVDILVLNTIEFWNGTNPLASNVGTTKQVMGQDGRYYAVTTLKNGYEVKAPTGEITNFIHNAENNSWSVEQNGVVKEMFRFNADGTIQANVNGETKNFALNEAGVYEARMAACGSFFAMN